MVDTTILDHRGDPIQRSEIVEPQTSRVSQLPQTFGGHPSRGLTPARLASILERAEGGDLEAQLDLAEDLEEKDGHIFAELMKRRRALLGLDWSIEPPKRASAAEEAATQQVREIMDDIEIDEIILDLADAISKGFACMEMSWERDQKVWLPAGVDLRPQRWFQIGKTRLNPQEDADEEIRLRDASIAGQALQPFGWVVHTHKARSGHLAKASLSRILTWPFLFKNYSVRDLAEFLEIYGLPLRLGTYPPGASDREKSTLLKAVMNIGHAAAGIVPEGMKVDFQEAAKGQADPFQVMMDWCERTQSKAIVGATLTSQADRGSNTNALGNVHNEVRHDLLVSDAKQIARTITRDIIYPIAALNTGAVRSVRRAPRFMFDTREAADLERYAKALPGLVRSGMRIPQRWAHDRLRIPEPEDDERVLEMGQQRLGTGVAKTLQHPQGCQCMGCLGRVAAARREDASDEQTAQMDRMGREAQPEIDGMIAAIREVIDSVDTLEELQERLLDIYPELGTDGLSEVMGQALTAAHLAGRHDLVEEAGGG